MTSLLEIREYIKNFYVKYELYITYVWKFLLSLIALTMISNKIGYQTNLTKLPILLMASLLCSIMPQNFMVLISAGFILAHLYKLSIFCAAIALIIFLLMFLFQHSLCDAHCFGTYGNTHINHFNVMWNRGCFSCELYFRKCHNSYRWSDRGDCYPVPDSYFRAFE